MTEEEMRSAAVAIWGAKMGTRIVEAAALYGPTALDDVLEDNARLRALVKDAEQSGVGLLCPWCQFPRKHGERGHKPDCPAFTPDGVVK